MTVVRVANADGAAVVAWTVDDSRPVAGSPAQAWTRS